MRRLMFFVAMMFIMASPHAKAEQVLTMDGPINAPAPGEEVPNASYIDPVTGQCIFYSGTTGPNLLFDSYKCTVTVDPDTKSQPQRREGVRWSGPIPPLESRVVEPEPTKKRHRLRGRTKEADPATNLITPVEPESKSSVNPRYLVGCPRVGVKMYANARWLKLEGNYFQSWLSVYAKSKFYYNLNNRGIGSIEYWGDWGRWYIHQNAYYRDGWQSAWFLGWGPIANGPTFVGSTAGVSFYNGRRGYYSTQWATVSAYNDLWVRKSCSIVGNPGPGYFRQECRSYLSIGYRTC